MVLTIPRSQAYLSPKVFPDLSRVPTWNYLAVNAAVEARPIHDLQETDAVLKVLIGDQVTPYAQQWRDLGPEFVEKMLKGNVAFELKLSDLRCKLELNQYRPEAFDAMIVAYKAGVEQSQP